MQKKQVPFWWRRYCAAINQLGDATVQVGQVAQEHSEFAALHKKMKAAHNTASRLWEKTAAKLSKQGLI